MKRTGYALAILLVLVLVPAAARSVQQAAKPAGQAIPVRYEELTSPEFVQAVARSGATCIIPLGILEKHGPHLPLGTDLIDCREVSLRAAGEEYTIVFPPYFVGQIFEAKNQPGTIAYNSRMLLDFLQQTCDELARNGIKKIILVNGHGGNDSFLHYFCQSQLESRRDYAVYLFEPAYDEATEVRLAKLRKTELDGHAGEEETSAMLAHRPDLVHLDKAGAESGEDVKRLAGLKYAYTGIWWYASQPNHYRGDGSAGNKEFGKALLEAESRLLVEMIRSVKKDTVTLELQKRFFDDAAKPLETKPFMKK
ncbi:MAG: creatininase family protein [Candidatus Aminicenantes bacterium]|nr:creatininase family protein [Candidatus Aminicenantes bacterium]TFG58074.1 MAG: creatininase family protein [Candidatus Aminicenantes bacterium]